LRYHIAVTYPAVNEVAWKENENSNKTCGEKESEGVEEREGEIGWAYQADSLLQYFRAWTLTTA
jgi:hypothetical protein